MSNMTSLFGFTSPAVKRLLGWKQGMIIIDNDNNICQYKIIQFLLENRQIFNSICTAELIRHSTITT